MQNFIISLFEPYSEYSKLQIALEIIAVVLGIASVFFSMRRNILVFPTGIISTSIYIYILFTFGLLGEGLIQVYYTIMSVYGWILWSDGKGENEKVEVFWANKKEWIIGGALFLICFLLIATIYYIKPWIENGFSMNNVHLNMSYLNWSNWLDIFVTAIFLVGMWFMAKRKVENWIFWIIGDLICIPIFIYNGLILTSIQFFFFTILAVMGYLEWKKSVNNIKLRKFKVKENFSNRV